MFVTSLVGSGEDFLNVKDALCQAWLKLTNLSPLHLKRLVQNLAAISPVVLMDDENDKKYTTATTAMSGCGHILIR